MFCLRIGICKGIFAGYLLYICISVSLYANQTRPCFDALSRFERALVAVGNEVGLSPDESLLIGQIPPFDRDFLRLGRVLHFASADRPSAQRRQPFFDALAAEIRARYWDILVPPEPWTAEQMVIRAIEEATKKTSAGVWPELQQLLSQAIFRHSNLVTITPTDIRTTLSDIILDRLVEISAPEHVGQILVNHARREAIRRAALARAPDGPTTNQNGQPAIITAVDRRRVSDRELRGLPSHVRKGFLNWVEDVQTLGLNIVRRDLGGSYHDEGLYHVDGARSVRLNNRYRVIYREVNNNQIEVIRIIHHDEYRRIN